MVIQVVIYNKKLLSNISVIRKGESKSSNMIDVYQEKEVYKPEDIL